MEYKITLTFVVVLVTQCSGGLLDGILNSAHHVSGAVLGGLSHGFNLNVGGQVGFNEHGGQQRPLSPPNHGSRPGKPDETIVVVVDEKPHHHGHHGTHYNHHNRPEYNNPSHGQGSYGDQNPNGFNHNNNGNGQHGDQNNYEPNRNPDYHSHGTLGNQNGNWNANNQHENQNNYGRPGYHGQGSYGNQNGNWNDQNQNGNQNQNFGQPNREPSYQGQGDYPTGKPNGFNQNGNWNENNQHGHHQNNGRPSENHEQDSAGSQNPNNNWTENNQHGYGNQNNYENSNQVPPQNPHQGGQGYQGQTTAPVHNNAPHKPTEANGKPDQHNDATRKPENHNEDKNEITKKPNEADDYPLFIPLNPNQYVYGGDKIEINAPKRETDKSPKPSSNDEDEDLPIDIRIKEE